MSRQATKEDLTTGTWVCSHTDEECDLYMIIGKRSGPADGSAVYGDGDTHWMLYGETRNDWGIWEWEKYLIDEDFYVIHEDE